MVLTLSISADTESRLRAKAAAEGMDVESFAARQLERAVAPYDIVEISGPIGEAFRQSGMTEDELSDLLESEKHQMRAERRARKNP